MQTILLVITLVRKILGIAAVFAVGGLGYAALELLWRGRTHWSMILAGGICMSIMFLIFRRIPGVSLFMRGIIGAVVITVVEFMIGCIVNNRLGLKIWDYSDQKWNIMGQICPLYSVLWGLLSLPVSQLCIVINNCYENIERNAIHLKRKISI